MAGRFKNIGEWQASRTPEQRKAQAKKANAKSREAKAAKKEQEAEDERIANIIVKFLRKRIIFNGEEMTGAEAMAYVAIEKALAGDLKAWEMVRDTAGQKPADKVLVSDIDADVIAEVEAIVNDTSASD